MHPLGTPEKSRVDGPFLDPAKFAERVASLLPAAKTR